MINNDKVFTYPIPNRIPYYIPVIEIYRVPQAKLPDINNAWVRYRNYGLECIDKRNYTGACAAIFEINALFPDKYRCEIDTDKYNELMMEQRVVVCPSCTKETDFKDIKIFDLILNLIPNILTNSTTEKVWNCPECKTNQKMINTKMIKDQHKQPFYFQLLREPPTRKGGISYRNSYHDIMAKWFFESLEQLDHQLGKYRDEYKPLEEQENDIAEGDEGAD